MTLSRRRFVRTFSRSGLAAVLGAAAILASPAVLEAQDDSPAAVPALIGDSARDLVFTPVPRCRIIDTRVEGGRLTAGVPRNFDVASTLAGQGGAADCGIPLGATVVLIKVTPVQAHGNGHLTAWPFGGAMSTGHVVRFNAGGRGARAFVPEVLLSICDPAVASCTHDLTIQATKHDTDIVADVSGYFLATAVPWAAVGGKPAGFADDIDNDTQYSAGTGLTQAGTVFNVDAAAVQSRVSQSCVAGSSIRVIGSSGTVTCEPDDNTTYAAGTGLSLSGTTFNVNPSAVQTRVAGTCAAGSSIRAIASTGAVTCETDTDTNTTYSAGFGLTLQGTTFSANTNSIQDRVTGTCDSAIRTINANGTVLCGPRILSGRDLTPETCNNGSERITFSSPFSAIPAVVLTPQGLSGTNSAPNTYCALGTIDPSYFEYCCWGNAPDNMGWIAMR